MPPKEPKIRVAPNPAPIGWGWSTMAGIAREAGWIDYAEHCDKMATRSIERGKDVSISEATEHDSSTQLGSGRQVSFAF